MRMFIRIFGSIVAICLPVALAATVYAADITVNSTCNLGNAITAANSDEATGDCPAGSGADTITLTGDVTLTAALPVIESEITIEGNGYTISGNERHQIFWVEETGALTIQNATLSDGRGVDDDDLFDEDLLIGGAIVNWGHLEVSDSVFRGNSATRGGAIANWSEVAISIVNCTFKNNTGPYHGAAVYSHGDAIIHINSSDFNNNSGSAIYSEGATGIEIKNSTFASNSAGAISSDGAATIRVSNSVFSINESHRGAAIHSDGEANIEISGSTFSDNLATYDGGAIHSWDDDAKISINDSMFINNSAKINNGGALHVRGLVNIHNSTFIGNSTNWENSDGGAIEFRGRISIIDSTFESNSAARDGGAMAISGEAMIIRSDFTNNSAAQSGGAIAATNRYGETSVSSSHFTDNSATEDGGAIYNEGAATIANSVFTGNSAGDEGGAIRSKEDSEVDVSQSIFRDNSAEDGGAIYSWGELTVGRSTFINNSAEEEGGGIANHGQASINSSILADNPGGDCHLGRRSELLESGNNHISDGSCKATWSGSVADGYCPPGQEQDGVCQIGAPDLADAGA